MDKVIIKENVLVMYDHCGSEKFEATGWMYYTVNMTDTIDKLEANFPTLEIAKTWCRRMFTIPEEEWIIDETEAISLRALDNLEIKFNLITVEDRDNKNK